VAELLTPDGEQVDAAKAEINASFDAVMNAEAGEAAAPPRRQPQAAAPDSVKPRRGRPPKDDKARSAPRPPAPPALGDDARREGTRGLVQVTAGVAMIAAKATGNPAFAADAITIVNHGDALADACVETARSSPAFAAALDKVCAAGPYAAMIGVGVAIVSQLARNHKPDLAIPGTVPPPQLFKPAVQKPAADGEQLPEAA
jgi:hypothetical protein